MDNMDSVLVPETGQTEPQSQGTPNGATAGATEGVQSTQPTETNAGGEGEGTVIEGLETSEPEMIPKSQYDNLRRDYTKKAMELADYKKGRKIPPIMQQQMQTSQSQQPQHQPQQVDLTKQPQPSINFGEYLDNMIEQKMAPLEDKQRALYIQSTVQALADKYEDFDDVSEDFVQALEENPYLIEAEGGIELAFKSARADYLEREAEARAIASVQAKQNTVAQKTAQVQTGVVNKGVTNQQPLSEADAIRESILGASGGFKFKF